MSVIWMNEKTNMRNKTPIFSETTVHKEEMEGMYNPYILIKTENISMIDDEKISTSLVSTAALRWEERSLFSNIRKSFT